MGEKNLCALNLMKQKYRILIRPDTQYIQRFLLNALIIKLSQAAAHQQQV